MSLLFGIEIFQGSMAPENIKAPAHIPINLYKLILAMMGKIKGEEVPSSKVAALEMDKLLTECGKTASHHTCVISIDDFINLTEVKKRQLIKNIISQNMNAVVLQGSESSTTKDYLVVRNYLASKKILNIAPFIAIGTTEEAVYTVAKDYYDKKLCTSNTSVFVYDTSDPSVNPQFRETAHKAIPISSVYKKS